MHAPMHAAPGSAHLATGVKTGEITSDSARIWTRRTRDALRNAAGIAARRTEPQTLALGYDITRLEGACPGDPGELRVHVRTAAGRRVYTSDWAAAETRARLHPSVHCFQTPAGDRVPLHGRDPHRPQHRRHARRRIPYRAARGRRGRGGRRHAELPEIFAARRRSRVPSLRRHSRLESALLSLGGR